MGADEPEDGFARRRKRLLRTVLRAPRAALTTVSGASRAAVRPGRPSRHLLVYPAVGALLLSGCASMPSSGDVHRVDGPSRTEAEAAVRVYGVSPEKGATPAQIVWGFLEATTSDEATFPTAKKYLTERAQRNWKPFSGTTVLSGGPTVTRKGVRDQAATDSYTVVQVTGTRIGAVDSTRRFSPGEGPHQSLFHLVRVDGEWRVDSLPNGLILGEADFQRIYRSVNKFYYAAYGPEAVAVPGGREVLVADPIYVRRLIDPVTDLVRALLAGPSGWLEPVVTSSFPEGTRLSRDERLSLDDSGELTVRLQGAEAVRNRPLACHQMATQLLHTVQGQASAKVTRVELASPDGGRLCDQTWDEASASAPGRLDGRAAQQYYIDAERRLVALDEDDQAATPVGGVFGRGEQDLNSVAVSRDETSAAAVAADGQQLLVAPLTVGSEPGAPVLTSKKSGEKGLSAPSWDGLGDLWVADRDPDRPRLLRLQDGNQEPTEVSVPDLGAGERITALRVASDGVRIALLVERNGHQTLELGRIERRGGVVDTELSVESLRSVAPQMEEVTAASWAGGSRLVVVGREAGGVQQLQFMETDGSAVHVPPLPGINDVTGVAASEDERKPVVAESAEGIVRLLPEANWRKLTDDGEAPVYPG